MTMCHVCGRHLEEWEVQICEGCAMIDPNALVNALNSTPAGPSPLAPAPADRNWDAERDAYADAEDSRERERHVRAAMANAAGRHPNATVIPKPAVATG